MWVINRGLWRLPNVDQPTPINDELCGAIIILGHGHEEPVEPRLLVMLVRLEIARLVRGRYRLTGKGWCTLEKIEAGVDVTDDLTAGYS
jgi:hypothetical protein